MTRRKLVALVGVIVLFTLGLVVFAAGLFVTHTDAGRERLRAFILPIVKNAIKGGDVYIGHLGGSFIGGLTVDSIAIRDKRGALFLSTGPLTVAYNWRDIADQRIYIRRATIEHPFVHIVQHESGAWNFKEIFSSPTPAPQTGRATQTRTFGDYIVLDSVTAHKGTFLLSMPWHPDDDLRGARRDSVIREHLGNPEKAVEKTFDGYARLYAWRNGSGLISHVRLADPDSDRHFGQDFKLGSLAVDEYVPTFKFLNVRGEVRHLGDSVWFDLPHFDMPASTGHGKGKVWWGSGLPVRYDIAVHGDSVSLDDVNWVYPTLPRTGGGTLDLAIKNDPKNLQVVDFRLQNMDVRTTRSRLIGDMWFGIGEPVLLVRNVNLKADPVDFDLIRTLNGKPFPIDWQGQLIGTVKGRGGPLTHFVVDDARGTFVDAHVRGAESRFAAKGELDILYPAFTTFHGLNVDVASLDLRTIEYLLPSFPRLGGFVAGTATLDSSWLDVRFSNANVTHQDGPGEPSRVTGSGRVTYGEKFMAYDVNLNAEPLALTMLARSYPALPPHLGSWTGPITATGSSPDLALKLALQSASGAGAFSYDGRVDIDSVGGMGATGHGQFSALNLAGLLEVPRPAGAMSGHYDVAVAGETAATLNGSASVELERTMLDSIRVYPSAAKVHFAGGQMKIDSLQLHTDAATIVASGGIGLPKGTADSVHIIATIDSLGGLRQFISHPDTTLLGAAKTLPDSLSGKLDLSTDAIGTLDAFRVKGRLRAEDVYFKTERVASGDAEFALDNVPSQPRGTVSLRLDTVVVAGVTLDHVGGALNVADLTHAGFAVDVLSRNGPTAAAAGTWSSDHGAQLLTLDSLGITIADDRWMLANRPRFVFDSIGTQLDSLVLRNKDSAVVAMSGRVPSVGAGFAQLHASGLPLRDFAMLAQLPDTASGVAGVTVSATGTRDNPTIDASAVLSSLRYHNVDFERVAATATHRNGTVDATLEAVRGGQTAITGSASLPVAVTLFGMKLLKAPITASVRADTTDLSILKLFMPTNSLPVITGKLAADVRVNGTWVQPVFNGAVAMIDGTAAVPGLGVTFNAINGRVAGGVNEAGVDSVNIAITARTSPRDHVSLTGFVRGLAQPRATAFSLSVVADSLHAFNKRSLADLYVSTINPGDPTEAAPLVLSGTLAAPVLSGTVNVDRGSIFLADPDLARKLPVDIFSDSGAAAPTTTMFSSLMKNLQMRNASVTLGQDVRLRSAEANVRLGGRLDMLNTPTGRSVAASGLPFPVTLVGQLTTIGGTYNFNLGFVQREFQVLPDGTVTFDGGSALTPLVDIRARYNVKQSQQRDLGVFVNLRGRMPTPSIELSSNADYAISSSDLLSYLIVGSPGFDFGASNQLASVLSPTVSALAADRLRQSLPFFDAFEFQLGTANPNDAQAGFLSRNNLQQYLYSSTVTAEKQLTSNLYLGVNTSFCQFQNSRVSLGANVEYRFKPQISLQAAYEPPSSHCVEGSQTVVGFVPTPSQWSLSLLHSWRF